MRPTPTRRGRPEVSNPSQTAPNVGEMEDLEARFSLEQGIASALEGIALSIPRGRIPGRVGESGAGERLPHTACCVSFNSRLSRTGRGAL